MKKTFRRIFAMILTVALVSSLVPAAIAVDMDEKTDDEAVMTSDDGRELKFVLHKSSDGDTYTMYFYMDDELIRTHTIEPGKSIKTEDLKTQKVTTTQILPKFEESGVDSQANRVPVRWTHLGYMYYQKSADFGCEAAAAISCRATDSRNSVYYVDTAVSKTVDYAVALVAGVLLGEAIGVYFASEAVANTIAQKIVRDMAVGTGAGIIGDSFGGMFREKYECVVTNYRISTQVVGTGISNTSKVTYDGVLYTVDYGEKSYAEESDDTYNPKKWKSVKFAKEIWKDSIPGSHTFPGVKGYPYDYPL